jgi:uncharacterized membrane protein
LRPARGAEAIETAEEILKELAGWIALGVEVVSVLVIAWGALDALIGLFQARPDPIRPFRPKKQVWLRFGVWLLLGLEFELAADIVRTVIAPTWVELGQLAAIAVIRTFLNYFLERDVEKIAEPAPSEAAPSEAAPTPVEARV